MEKIIMKRAGKIITFSQTKGDNFNILKHIDSKNIEICGWKTMWDGSFERNIQVGDLLKLKGNGDKIGFFLVLENKTTYDPEDIFFAKIYNIASCDENDSESITYEDIYTFAKENDVNYLKYFNLKGGLEVNMREFAEDIIIFID